MKTKRLEKYDSFEAFQKRSAQAKHFASSKARALKKKAEAVKNKTNY